MQVKVNQTTFHPSRSLLPFAGAFLLISIFVVIRFFPDAPVYLFILLLPYLFFIFWWFVTLMVLSFSLTIVLDPNGIIITQPVGSFFEKEIIQLTWTEIKSVSFEYSEEFTPAAFTGRSGQLEFKTIEDKKVVVDHIMIIENYTTLFAIIQQYIPFVYQLPREQLINTKTRQCIVVGVAIIFLVVFLLFIT